MCHNNVPYMKDLPLETDIFGILCHKNILIWVNPRIFIALQITFKTPSLGARPSLKGHRSSLDLTSNEELEFPFFLVSKEER